MMVWWERNRWDKGGGRGEVGQCSEICWREREGGRDEARHVK